MENCPSDMLFGWELSSGGCPDTIWAYICLQNTSRSSLEVTLSIHVISRAKFFNLPLF